MFQLCFSIRLTKRTQLFYYLLWLGEDASEVDSEWPECGVSVRRVFQFRNLSKQNQEFIFLLSIQPSSIPALPHGHLLNLACTTTTATKEKGQRPGYPSMPIVQNSLYIHSSLWTLNNLAYAVWLLGVSSYINGPKGLSKDFILTTPSTIFGL